MTQQEIIEMAKEAGMDYLQHISPEAFEKVKTFAKLVEDKVRDDIIEKNKPVLQSVNDYIKKLENEITRLRGEA
jgi:hypothetical protein